jgi:hypothetical protein
VIAGTSAKKQDKKRSLNIAYMQLFCWPDSNGR